MGHHFETEQRAEVTATPEQVWSAIATGPGIDSWFLGRTEISGGAVRTDFGGGLLPPTQLVASEPPHRLAHGSQPDPDGRFIAYEYLVEAQSGGTTVIRAVTSGFIPGADWEAEFDAMSCGGELFFSTLVQYLTHFPGRVAAPVTAFGPIVTDWPRAWATLFDELGLPAAGQEGRAARITLPGTTPVDGVVYLRNSQTLGIRAADGLYRFLRGFHGPMIAAHHHFGQPDEPATGHRDPALWQRWLTHLHL